MQIETAAALSSIDPQQWNALLRDRNPFVTHEFLEALERHGCAARATGWQPAHLIARDSAGRMIGALPTYRKRHSWGEFVFDWSWANAYSRLGLNYYPKLVATVPFTPAPGPRLLAIDESVRSDLIQAMLDRARSQQLSSAHVLFPAESDVRLLKSAGFLIRKDCQFHWHNRGYDSFDDFVATFRADKRKKALRERRRVAEAGIEMRMVKGSELSEQLWRTVFGFSERTFNSHGHEHYLTAEFLMDVAKRLPNSIMVVLALRSEIPIAAAIFFRSHDTLYGRYWGSSGDYHSLHFETCYYQGIEYCIQEGLQHFEPGTQGEHKIARGFEPTVTWSAHWLADQRIAQALQSHLADEVAAVDQYMAAVDEHLPFHRHV